MLFQLLGQTSETLTIAIPVGAFVLIGQMIGQTVSAWITNKSSRLNGTTATDKEMVSCLKSIAASSQRTLEIVSQPGPDGGPLIYKASSVGQVKDTLDRVADRLERHMEFMENRSPCNYRRGEHGNASPNH